MTPRFTFSLARTAGPIAAAGILVPAFLNVGLAVGGTAVFVGA
jgi:hypothetical protein